MGVIVSFWEYDLQHLWHNHVGTELLSPEIVRPAHSLSQGAIQRHSFYRPSQRVTILYWNQEAVFAMGNQLGNGPKLSTDHRNPHLHSLDNGAWMSLTGNVGRQN